MLPGATRINRGSEQVASLVAACQRADATDIVVVHETRGVPDALVVSHLPYGPTARFSLANVVLRHDVPGRTTVSEQFPHLVFEGFSSKLGLRAKRILQYSIDNPGLYFLCQRKMRLES